MVLTAYNLRVPQWVASFTLPKDPTPMSLMNLNSEIFRKYPLGTISICIRFREIINLLKAGLLSKKAE